MSTHVLLNLLNELRKRDKMQGLPSILSLFRMISYEIMNTLKSHFWREKQHNFVIMCATLLWTS